MERHFQCALGFGDTGQRQDNHVAKTSCRESLMREQEVLVLAEEMKAQGSVDENSRVVLARGLNQAPPKNSGKRKKRRKLLDETGQEKATRT